MNEETLNEIYELFFLLQKEMIDYEELFDDPKVTIGKLGYKFGSLHYGRFLTLAVKLNEAKILLEKDE